MYLFRAESVSFTALVGGDVHVREAHRESVRVALGELERYTQARIGKFMRRRIQASFLRRRLSMIRHYLSMVMQRHSFTLTLWSST